MNTQDDDDDVDYGVDASIVLLLPPLMDDAMAFDLH